jgi:hypothetical protein
MSEGDRVKKRLGPFLSLPKEGLGGFASPLQRGSGGFFLLFFSMDGLGVIPSVTLDSISPFLKGDGETWPAKPFSITSSTRF